MNADILKGKWNQLQGDAKREWGKLTDDDLKVVEGDSTKLSGVLQERYGYNKEEADRRVNDWIERQRAG
ncbi:MAG: CsbD family protein [Opitutales bacterium]